MKYISFFHTQKQFRVRTKTVTRRLGWKNLKVGDVLMGCVKSQGIRKGEKIQKLGPIKVVNVRREALKKIDQRDCVLEGFPEINPASFVKMYCRNFGCTPARKLTRIEFNYL